MKSSELMRILKKDGWFEVRQSGSHVIMKHYEKKAQIVVPYHGGKELPKGTLKSILKDSEIKIQKR